jgi:hypothetical protein
MATIIGAKEEKVNENVMTKNWRSVLKMRISTMEANTAALVFMHVENARDSLWEKTCGTFNART